MNNLYCKRCLCSRSDDVLGAACRTTNCGGTIEEEPEFSTLIDILPEPMTCGRRAENGMDQDDSPFKHSGKNLDRWEKFKSNGNRVCSYCGSLHPDDMFALVKASAEAPEDAEHNKVVAVEPSDKRYKVYIHQPGVRNAHEGGIKFYHQHLPRGADGKIAVTDQQQAEYAEAVRRTRLRFEKYLAQQYPRSAGNGTIQ